VDVRDGAAAASTGAVEVTTMRARRALVFGIIGAAAMSVVSAGLRAAGAGVNLELLLGTLPGGAPSPTTFALGLALHLTMGALFGLLYGYLFEHVWDHGGASTGMLLAVIHAALIGMLVGLTPQFHPKVPEVLPDPGPFFANAGLGGVLTFFALHVLYGAIVGAGYGHVEAEHEWAPAGRL
jgi:hypothetical protein